MARRLYLFLCLALLFLEYVPPEPEVPLSIPVTGPALAPPPEPVQVTIAAVGDIMMHTPQITAAYDPDRNTHDFLPAFQYVRPYLADADLTLGNLETPQAGPARGYPGYPRFNAPDELAPNLKETGFDVIITANNHALDQGAEGVAKTIATLEAAGLHPVGTARSAAEKDEITIEEVKGLRVAVLAYTYGTNGLPLPKDQPYLVNLLDKERVTQDVTRARAAGADIVLVYLHFGQEYAREPGPEEQQLAAEIAAAGADIILGSHPHVLQRGERLGETREKVIIYSLGNFISAQKGLYRQIGAIWKIHLEQDPSSQAVTIRRLTYLPTYTCRYREAGRLKFTVIPLQTAVDATYPSPCQIQDRQPLMQAWHELNGTLGKLGDLEEQ
ncbi:MAG: CapA family protein [Clostridia bacterium]|nr:MAG: CapA family protein [Clostridia bacterium]